MAVLQISQVLLLFDAAFSERAGLSLWTALIEVEKFYNADRTRAHFHRQYISPFVPNDLQETDFRGISRSYGGDDVKRAASELFSRQPTRNVPTWEMSPAAHLYPPYDSRQMVDDIGPIVKADGVLMIVTDREIVPPEGWRYIISDDVRGTTVVSVAPLDPYYWRDPDPSRIWTIKKRLRNVLLSCTGVALGFQRCDNPSCYLNGMVDSVSAIDYMTELGEEHDAASLAGRVFDAGQYPDIVQQIATQRGTMR
jgi:hypothetical protein